MKKIFSAAAMVAVSVFFLANANAQQSGGSSPASTGSVLPQCAPIQDRLTICEGGADACMNQLEACQGGAPAAPTQPSACQQECTSVESGGSWRAGAAVQCVCPRGKRLSGCRCLAHPVRAAPAVPPAPPFQSAAAPPPPVAAPPAPTTPGSCPEHCPHQDDADDETGDKDCDAVANAEDNCPRDCNPEQQDLDGDGVGAMCDDEDNATSSLVQRLMMVVNRMLQNGASREELQAVQAQLDALPDDFVGSEDLAALRTELQAKIDELARRYFSRFTLGAFGLVMPRHGAGGVSFLLRLFQNDGVAVSMGGGVATDSDDVGFTAYPVLVDILLGKSDGGVEGSIGLGPTFTYIEEEPFGGAKYGFRGFMIRPAMYVRLSETDGPMLSLALPLAAGQWNRSRDGHDPAIGGSVGLEIGVTLWGR